MERLPSADVHFRTLYDEHFEAIRAYCMRRVRVEDVNDAVSDVFLVAWRRLDSVPDGDASRLWMYGVARNVVANRTRSNRRARALRRKAATVTESDVPDPASLVVENESAKAAVAALARLSEKDQEIVRLRIWEELSSAEIADVVGLSPAAVDMRLSRSRKKLNKLLRVEQPNDVRSRQLEGGETR